MRKIKAHIKSSATKDLIFNVYRNIESQKLPTSTEQLSLLQPIMIVDESKATSKAYFIKNETIALDVSSIVHGDLVPYAIKYPVLKDPLHDVKVSILYDAGEQKDFTIKFNYKNEIQEIKNDKNLHEDVSKTFELKGNTVLEIKHDVVVDSSKISISYFTEVIEVVDLNEPQEGVTYYGPIPTGIPNPDLVKSNEELKISSSVTLPFFKLSANMPEEGTKYYYRAVAKDKIGNISDPSDLCSIELKQPDVEMEYVLQSCNNLHPEDGEPKWENTGIIMVDDQVLEFGKKDSDQFKKQGTILVQDKPKSINKDEISISSRKIPSPALVINIPNIWTNDKYLLRTSKAFRLKGILKSNNQIFTPSDVIQQEDFRVSFDKIIVRRKELLSDVSDDETPCSLQGEDAETVATFIKKDGITYDTIKKINPENLDEENLNTAKFEKGMHYSLMNAECGLSALQIVDSDIIEGKNYRYTIYCVDDFEVVSDAVSYDGIYKNNL